LIHQIWADRRPAAAPGRGGFLRDEDILGNIAPDMKQGIRNTFFAVREYARSRFPEQTRDILNWEYTYKITKEDEPSGGTSAGLPTAVALLSVFLQVPVPQDVAFTGVIVADAHDALAVRRVGDADEKVRGAYGRNLRKIVLPADNRADLAASCAIPPAVEDEIVLYAQTLDEALSLTFGPELWLR
jgi:ATP-dependent Lon protease